MTFAQRQLLIALLALMCGGAALAADAPKADENKDGKEAKPAAAAEPELPSKPYPANATPKAFAPKAEPKKAEPVAAAKPAEKGAEKAADKHAEKAVEKAADKAADKPAAPKATVVAHQPGHDKPTTRNRRPAATPAPTPVTDPAMAAVARESLKRSPPGGAYQVRAGDNLDTVIRKTMPNSPFSMEVMREAYARANPQLLASVKAMRLRAGTTLNVPDAAVFRLVVLGDGAPPAEPVMIKASELYTAAPVVAPTAPASTSDQNPTLAIPRLAPDVPPPASVAEVSPEEKKKWVRYP